MAEVAEDDVLDLYAGGVVGEDQGHSVPSGLTGGWGEGRGTGNMGDTLEGRVNNAGGEAPFFEKGSHLLCSRMKRHILRADAAEFGGIERRGSRSCRQLGEKRNSPGSCGSRWVYNRYRWIGYPPRLTQKDQGRGERCPKWTR